MRIFSVSLNKTEFSVIGIANVAKGIVSFQGLVNGVPFTQGDYQEVSRNVLKAVQINKQKEKAN